MQNGLTEPVFSYLLVSANNRHRPLVERLKLNTSLGYKKRYDQGITLKQSKETQWSSHYNTIINVIICILDYKK